VAPARRTTKRRPPSAELAQDLQRLDLDLPAVLAAVPVPVYVLSRAGTIRWLNQRALDVFGDRRGEHFGVLLAPESRSLVEEQFARKILGTAPATSYHAIVLMPDGSKVHVDIDSVRVSEDSEAVGVFGVADPERPEAPSAPQVHLTPRQREILTLLAHGRSTVQIAEVLHLSQQTVRNHVRGVLGALASHSRLEAVSRAHELGLV
jgi:DNA-binding CsgD family transcriptional regulator